MDRGRRLWIPAGALIAHVLQPHRLANGLGENRGVHGTVVGIVAAIGTWTGGPDHVNVGLRYAERGGDTGLHEVRLLGAAPTGGMTVLEIHQRASRTHRGVRLKRPLVFGLDHPRRRLEGVVDIADLFADFAFAGRRLANVVVQRSLIGKRRRDLRPLDLELLRRFDRAPLLIGDHAEEALVPDHLGGRDILDRAFVDLDRYRAGDSRPDHAAVNHAGDFDVGGEIRLSKNLGSDVVTRKRLSDDRVILRILRLRLAGRIERIAVFAIPVEMNVEVLPADQLGVADCLGGIASGVDDAVGHRELIGRNAELVGCHLDQHAFCFGGGHAHLLAAFLHAGRTGCAALIDAGVGVADENPGAGERNIELFRHHLPDGDVEPLPHVHLAEIDIDAAVGVDGDVGG